MWELKEWELKKHINKEKKFSSARSPLPHVCSLNPTLHLRFEPFFIKNKTNKHKKNTPKNMVVHIVESDGALIIAWWQVLGKHELALCQNSKYISWRLLRNIESLSYGFVVSKPMGFHVGVHKLSFDKCYHFHVCTHFCAIRFYNSIKYVSARRFCTMWNF